jgi:hypothetical protein
MARLVNSAGSAPRPLAAINHALPDRIAQSAALRLGLRCGFVVTDSQSFALRNPAI